MLQGLYFPPPQRAHTHLRSQTSTPRKACCLGEGVGFPFHFFFIQVLKAGNFGVSQAMRARGHAPASPSGGSDGAAASGFNPSPFPARASARPLLSCLYEAGSSRLLRLLYLNALLLALFVTRDMAYRDFPKVWVLTRGGISAPPQGPIGGLIGSKYAGCARCGANGPGSLTAGARACGEPAT